MCETPGFVSSKAAGKEVRCANPECLLPIFTAPQIQKKEPVEETPAHSGLPRGLLVALAAVLAVSLAVVCWGVWFFLLDGDGSNEPTLSSPPKIADTGPPPPGDTSQNGRPEPSDDPGAVVAERLTFAEIKQRALKLMIEASRNQERNRSKPYCQRLTAEAFAHTGDLDGAREQLNSLKEFGPEVPYYHVMPLVTIAWKELEAGRKNAAQKTLDEAFHAAQALPRHGRYRYSIDAATALATVLAAAGRDKDARSLMDSHHNQGGLGQLSAKLQVVREFQTYDLEAAVLAEPLRPWKAPQWTAVTLGLAAHGYWDEALAWAERHPGIEERTDGIVAWAVALIGQTLENKQPDKWRQIETVAQKLTPAAKARLFARVAGRQLAGGDELRAEQSLKKARAAMGALPVPSIFTLPGMKELYDLQLPDPIPLRMAALAAAETARVEAQLGAREAAWKSLALAMTFARAMAPSPPAIQSRLDDIKNLGTRFISNQLKAALELDSYDEARSASWRYRKQCRKIKNAAQARFQLQTTLLSQAADWNLHQEIWNEIQSRAEHADLDHKEPFFETPLPWILAERCRQSGADDRAVDIQTALTEAERQPDRQQQLKQETARLIADGKGQQAAERIEFAAVDKTWCSGWMMQLACRLVNTGHIEPAFRFVKAFSDRDPILREDAFQLIAALATRNGYARQVWTVAQDSELTQTEIIALCRGLIAGISPRTF